MSLLNEGSSAIALVTDWLEHLEQGHHVLAAARVPVGPLSLRDLLPPQGAWDEKGDESGELPACFLPPDSIFKDKKSKPWKTARLARTACSNCRTVCSNFC